MSLVTGWLLDTDAPVGAAPSEAGTQSPAEFLALQVSRLNEALLVAYGAMSAENLEAVDRVVKIVRELDRYHGFAVQAATPRPPRLPPPSAAPLALEAPGARTEPIRNRLRPFDSRAEMAAPPKKRKL